MLALFGQFVFIKEHPVAAKDIALCEWLWGLLDEPLADLFLGIVKPGVC